MKKCERCGKLYDEETDKLVFNDEWPPFKYDNIRPTLCLECIEEAYDDDEEGVYFDTCELCGQEFDYGRDNYDILVNRRVRELFPVWKEVGKVVCGDCVGKMIDEKKLQYDNDVYNS